MPPSGAQKRTPKATKSLSPSPKTTPVPAPFAPAPDSLKPFLRTLNKRNVYITHIDTHPAWFKRRIFSVPVLLNLTILVLLLWRAKVIVPWYGRLLMGIFERKSSGNGNLFAPGYSAGAGDVSGGGKMGLIKIILRRTLTFAIDYILVTIIWPWPITFFLERPGNPCLWRWHLGGFREKEVIVRVSRKWYGEDLVGGVKKGGESPFFKTRVMPYVTEEIWRKTGYLLMGKDWDLDFAEMVVAQGMVDVGLKSNSEHKLEMADLDKKVFVWVAAPGGGDVKPTNTQEQGHWAVWDIVVSTARAEIDDDQLPSEGSEDVKNHILMFKDKLTAMGKEDLFFKWVDLVQTEARKPEFKNQDAQFELGLKVQALFEEEGVDWQQFAKDVGL